MEGKTGYIPMEALLPEKTAHFVARLQIGANEPGRVKSKLENNEEIALFGEMLAEHVSTPNKVNTADCIDERITIKLGNGDADPSEMADRIRYQLPGGLILATTKAFVAADVPQIRQAKSFREAYEMTFDYLKGFGYEDGGHAKCGASALVEKSVAEAPERKILLSTVGALVNVEGENEHIFDEVQANKARKLSEGFYGGWKPEWHEGWLQRQAADNFSFLATNSDAVHGHYGDGLLIINSNNAAFAKNQFTNTTGKSAFAATMPLADTIARLAAPADEDLQKRISMAFRDDLVIIGHQLLAKDFPVYSIAA